MSVLSELDAALHELGMLSAVTESRKKYLKEQEQHHCIPNRPALNVLHINTRYVTGVAIRRREGATVRYKPYPGPCWGREERTRTKSENSDLDLDCHNGIAMSSVPSQLLEVNSLHKSRSMESVTINVSDDESAFPPTQEVESVSSKIQQLQVNECWGREEGTRTKSENSDLDLDCHNSIAMSSVPSQLLEVSSLHKSRSMESVTINVSDDESASPPTQEVESVSSKIQQLQVNE